MGHIFNVGQLAALAPRILRPPAPGLYEVRHLDPISEREPGNPSYRIKSPAEKHDRVVAESNLAFSAPEFI